MKRSILSGAAAAAVGLLLLVACNNVGTCPSASSIKAGASCSGDSLTCAANLESPSPACDGTNVEGGIQTSCTCTGGVWRCPAVVSCEAGPGDDGGAEGGGGDASDGSTSDSATSEAGDDGSSASDSASTADTGTGDGGTD